MEAFLVITVTWGYLSSGCCKKNIIDLNNRHLFLPVLEDGKAKIKV